MTNDGDNVGCAMALLMAAVYVLVELVLYVLDLRREKRKRR